MLVIKIKFFVNEYKIVTVECSKRELIDNHGIEIQATASNWKYQWNLNVSETEVREFVKVRKNGKLCSDTDVCCYVHDI